LISLPLWSFLVLSALALWSVVDRLLVPGARWFLRRRVNRVLEEVSTRLSIRIQPFKLTKRRVLLDQLLYDREVLAVAETAALEEAAPREVVMARVASYAEEIVPAFNAYVYFRVGYAIARRVARFLFRVRLGTSDEAGMAAIAPDSTVVFLMNHRSNMDYILVGYLAAEKTALSYAVGEWARIWPLQTLFRSMGAYFIRRDSKNPLYRKVLERYVAMATAAGVTQAVYPEGGLSRDGRLRPPRLGILDYMVRGFDPNGERDIVFVPVGINYDRTLEDRTLLLGADLSGVKTGLSKAIGNAMAFAGKNLVLMARNRWHRFGYACVNFGSPVSLRAWTHARGLDFRPLAKEERFARVGELANELMGAIARVIPVLPVPLVATVFAAHPDLGMSELELKGEVARLMDELERSGAPVYIPRGDQDYAITVGLRMLTLRHVVTEAEGVFRIHPEGKALLDYYAGSIAHLVPRHVAC
jgi:glycerol-3-phosphate O-acyltransferase